MIRKRRWAKPWMLAGLLLMGLPLTAQRWQPLFDGQTLQGWKPLMGSARFAVEQGEIIGYAVAGSPNTFLVTEKPYGDFILELELKVEHVSSNSGIMIRGQWDASAREGRGLVYGYQVEADPSTRAWSGGIYDEARRGWLYPLDLNPAAKSLFRLGEWNRYRVECIGHEMRTHLNGRPVAALADTVDATGFIGLQVHSIQDPADAGRKTAFRNIRIQTGKKLRFSEKNADVFLVNNLHNQLTISEKYQGYRLLFNGKDTSGWTGVRPGAFSDTGWHIHGGIITIEAGGGGEASHVGDLVTTNSYAAFDFSFDFRLTPGANSGVKYFVTLQEKTGGSAIGLEYQLLDDERHPDAKLGRDGNRTLASLYDLIKADKQPRFVRPIGEWNKGRIVVYPDQRVEHYLNGVRVLSYQRGSEAYRALVAISKYKVWERFGEAASGRILLQDHGNHVDFKNLKIKEL